MRNLETGDQVVMARLLADDPAIPVLATQESEDVDARHKDGHDELLQKKALPTEQSYRFAARLGAGATTGGTGAGAAAGAPATQRLRCQASSANLAWPRTAMSSLR